MATITLGTAATSSLTALNWNPMSPVADVATIAEAIQGQNAYGRHAPQDFSKGGLLRLPGGRGIIKLLPGDYIGVDANGWPIVVSSQSIAGQLATTSWTHS